MKPYVKICGLTRPEDARLAVSLGATHVGAVRAPGSPRSVSVAQAKAVFKAAGEGSESVLVCRDLPIDQAVADAAASGARALQLYDQSPSDLTRARASGLRVYRVVDMDEETDIGEALDPPPTEEEPVVLDVGRGGSGRSFDWSRLAPRAPRACFVAGGIRPDNLRALLAYEPWGIDLSSGVESGPGIEPGIKDASKLRALFELLEERNR